MAKTIECRWDYGFVFATARGYVEIFLKLEQS